MYRYFTSWFKIKCGREKEKNPISETSDLADFSAIDMLVILVPVPTEGQMLITGISSAVLIAVN
jgi:hypothetical protein